MLLWGDCCSEEVGCQGSLAASVPRGGCLQAWYLQQNLVLPAPLRAVYAVFRLMLQVTKLDNEGAGPRAGGAASAKLAAFLQLGQQQAAERQDEQRRAAGRRDEQQQEDRPEQQHQAEELVEEGLPQQHERTGAPADAAVAQPPQAPPPALPTHHPSKQRHEPPQQHDGQGSSPRPGEGAGQHAHPPSAAREPSPDQQVLLEASLARAGAAGQEGPEQQLAAAQQQQQGLPPQWQGVSLSQVGLKAVPGPRVAAGLRMPAPRHIWQSLQPASQLLPAPCTARSPSPRRALPPFTWLPPPCLGLPQMDASALECLPYEVQRELVGAAGGQPPPQQQPPWQQQPPPRHNQGDAQQRHADEAAGAGVAAEQEAKARGKRPLLEEDAGSEEGGRDWVAAAAQGGALPAPHAAGRVPQPQPPDRGRGDAGAGSSRAAVLPPSPIVALPALSQVDPAVLEVLPLAMRRELEVAYGGGSTPAHPLPLACKAVRAGTRFSCACQPACLASLGSAP